MPVVTARERLLFVWDFTLAGFSLSPARLVAVCSGVLLDSYLDISLRKTLAVVARVFRLPRRGAYIIVVWGEVSVYLISVVDVF